MVRYGMTPMQAIQSATTVAAALFDQQDHWAQSRRASSPTSWPCPGTR